MIKIPNDKIFNAYIIETYNYSAIKKSIMNFAISIGFDKKYVESYNHPDIVYIESETNIKIDVIRNDIIETSVFAPKIANKKIYIIYDSVNMDFTVQNTLLKTLEEPPEFDIFFLITSNVSKFLETIKSRCFIIKDNEEIDYKELLDLNYLEDAINILANVKSDTLSKRMLFADKFLSKENNLKDLIRFYRYFLRDILFYKMTYSKERIILKELENYIMAIAGTFSLSEIGHFVDNLNKLVESNNNYTNKKIAIFNFFEV